MEALRSSAMGSVTAHNRDSPSKFTFLRSLSSAEFLSEGKANAMLQETRQLTKLSKSQLRLQEGILLLRLVITEKL